MLNWSPIIVTLKLAFVTTFILMLLSIPLSYWLSNTKSKLKSVVETLISLPLVLPPTVIGFYLLIAYSPENFLGNFLDSVFNIRLAFSFSGLVIGSIIYSLPFMVQPMLAGLRSLPNSITEASYVLGKSRWKTLWLVLIPNIKPSILTATVLTFAHTVGEFGIVLMVGGNIPNETKVLSVAIYDEVESLNYASAHLYSGILIAVSFVTLLFVYMKQGNRFTFLK